MSNYPRLALTCLLLLHSGSVLAVESDWPPPLSGAKDGTAMLHSPQFLQVPDSVAAAAEKAAAKFTLAKTPPTVHLAYHQNLGPDAQKRRLWSSWGDICLASDGHVYCGIGDHGDDAGGDARCFLYRWDPKTKRLERVLDVNSLLPDVQPHSRWSKLHAKIDEGPDGGIYFSATLNDGNRAGNANYKWSEQCPGGQLYRFDPQTGQAEVFANLPPRRCTATSLLDRERNVWWCNLEAGEGNALFALDLATRKPLFQASDGSLGFNRAFALGYDGAIYYNGTDSIMRCDPQSHEQVKTAAALGDSPGIRCASRESAAGDIFGVMHKTTQLYRFSAKTGQLELLGPNWLAGSYTTVCELSPDERFLYYLPGAHGGAFKDGTPIIQYEIANKQQKVLAFLAPVCQEQLGYVPAGTYGMKLSADGDSLYVNFNGHAADRLRPAAMKPNGFGLCAFAEIEIPATER
jgi:hypothetical protein